MYKSTQGDKMKTANQVITDHKMQQLLKFALILTVFGLLTACGSSKSNSSPTVSSSNRFDINSQKSLANCNKSVDTNFSFNTSIVTDQNGQPSTEFIKFKFNFINANITKAGNVLKFFKWRVANGQSVLSETPLQVSAYDPASGQTVTQAYNSLPADQINGAHNFYINLADPNGLFQVLKVVAYDSEGKIIGNINSLIPSFNASPADYAFNSDGTARAGLLQEMHGLYGAVTTGWTPEQYTNNFAQYCF